MSEVTPNLRHVAPSFGSAVEVDNGVTVLNQVRPHLMGNPPCG